MTILFNHVVLNLDLYVKKRRTRSCGRKLRDSKRAVIYMDMHRNKLKYSKAYLVGPMDHDREAGKDWRITMADWLVEELGVIPFDPYNKPLHRMHTMGLEDDDNYQLRKAAIARDDRAEARRLTKPIVSTDLRIVDHADFLVVNFDVDSHPGGTIDEMVTAANQNKPVIVMCPQGVNRIYDWFWGRLRPEIFFDSWNDVKEYLKHIAFDDEVDDLGKWKFFDIEDTILSIVSRDYVK
jgi:hypothetical protein